MKFLNLLTTKACVLYIVLFCVSTVSSSQNLENTNTFWDHVRFGGGIGLSFGDGFFSGTLAPSAIYQFNEEFGLGLGLNGTYNSLKNNYNSTILGVSVISLFNPIPELQVSGEFEQLNVNQKFENSNFEDENYWLPALYVGLGYRTNNVTFGMRYDLLFDKNKSVFANAWTPFVRVFF